MLQIAEAAEKEAESYQIVALGDSLTAGYEYGFDAKSVPYGYAEHVYEQALFHGLRAEYANYGLLGLTSTGFSNLLNAVKEGKSVKVSEVQPGLKDPRAAAILSETVQIEGSIRGADLIIMTIGGNDLLGLDSQLTSTTTDEEKAQLLQAVLAQFETELTDGLQAATSLAPTAKFVIADQYMPIPASVTIGGLSLPLPKDAALLREFQLKAVSQINEKLKTIVAATKTAGFDISIAEVSKSFVGKELGYTSIANKDVHPTRLGYAAMGETYSTTIWNEYLSVRTRPANVPVSIVVRGKELAAASPATMKSNRTFVPMRDITDAIGATLVWNKTNQTATISYNNHTVAFTIGSPTILVDGVKKKLNSPAAYLQKSGKEQKTYLPLAVLSEELGLQVTYRSTLQAVFIN
ncbi:stalk domain-containing protein [Paenibacillus sp. KS-LC4]|uniref:stalk domain-containing protein n=1 Tax=Paenibacillus sp. KS-LC4 TaxID=2979727 RepID=UPI0030CEEDA7